MRRANDRMDDAIDRAVAMISWMRDGVEVAVEDAKYPGNFNVRTVSDAEASARDDVRRVAEAFVADGYTPEEAFLAYAAARRTWDVSAPSRAGFIVWRAEHANTRIGRMIVEDEVQDPFERGWSP